jgi:cation transport regulator ChaC
MTGLPESSPTWIFGYGSLMWRPDFEFAERREGFVCDLSRRFWQASTDHRGIPAQPGRVVTLIREAGARCFGAAYRLRDQDREGVLARLDHRERGGFVRERVPVHFADTGGGARESVQALVYIATEINPNYLGPAPMGEIARQIRGSRGPSGSNAEYLAKLAAALRAMGAEDDHVFALAQMLEASV